MSGRTFFRDLVSALSGLSLRTKLIVLLVLVMVIPLLVSWWFARHHAQVLGERVSKQTAAMTHEMRESVMTVGTRTTNDAIRALELLSREKIERLSTDIAHEIAAFLYDRDDDIRFVAGLPLTEASFSHFLSGRTREVIEHGQWTLAPNGQSWIPASQPAQPPHEVSPPLRENQIGFHYRPPETDGMRIRRPLYLEMTFVDLEGRERLKITTTSRLSSELRDVSRKENTYCQAETYFHELRGLGDWEIYVSSVIGAYVPSTVTGPYLPERVLASGIVYEPEESGYAGKENPVGKRFEGLIRWAAPVLQDGRRIGYVTLALDHRHLMGFTDHTVPTGARYCSIPDASTGNYAFTADCQGRIIAHPRHYHIIGYDPATGESVPPWLDEETYEKWKRSGKRFSEFVQDVPEYDSPSRHKRASLEQEQAGQLGLDYRYLNFAPQCLGFQTLTTYGGSGSFHLFWDGLWKLNATAAIHYYTGQYGAQRRGFGHVGITANISEFHSPVVETKNYIDEFIAERDAGLARQQDDLYRTISDNVAQSMTRLGESTAAMIVILVGLAAWIASALRNRVAAITRGVRDFQAGKLKERLKAKSSDELGQLATAFNQMAQSIETSYETLSKSEKRFRAIFNQTFQIAGFLTPQGIVLAANSAMQEFLGVTESELVGKPCWALPWWTDSTDLQRLVPDAVRKAAEGQFLRFEATSACSLGDMRVLDFSLKPFKDDSGSVVNLVLEARDITELKNAENELRRHRDQLEVFVQERTRDLTSTNKRLQREIGERQQAEYKVRAERDKAQRYLDIAGAIIVLIDSHHKTALINKKGCEVLGYTEGELIGSDWFEAVVSEDDRDSYRSLLSMMMSKGAESVEYAENTVLTKDGRPLTIAWQISVLTDMGGKAIGTLSSGVDITQRKRTEEELRRARDAAEVANRTKSAFLANISHEIRTPLNAILGFCQLMLRDFSIAAQHRQSIERINRSGEHLLALINEVLEMSKIESGCSAVNPADLDLYRLLEDIEMMFRVRTDAKGLQFEVSTSEGLARHIVADQGKIRQVLINLLGNAVKFTDNGGVLLRVSSQNGCLKKSSTECELPHTGTEMQLILEVEDTGVGISPQDRERIFQPFEQLGTGAGEEGGTGLGLAICKEFAGIMGGAISVTSRNGQGSVFRVEIPVARGSDQSFVTSKPKARVVGLQPGQPRYRILVVDDIRTNREILSAMLVAVGFQVNTADNGKQAVDLFSEWRPHAVLMDMKMPVMDGLQATKEIRTLPGGRNTVIIAVSAGAWEEERKTVLAEGLDDFIRKPFRETDVYDALRLHLDLEYAYQQRDGQGNGEDVVTAHGASLELDSCADLPPELIDQLSEAAQQLDLDRLNGLLCRVGEVNPAAAGAVSRLLKRYDFETLIRALRNRKDEQ